MKETKPHQPPKKRVTIKDIAKAADCSIATVSYVLNNTTTQSISDDTRKKVLQFANILGYECNVMARYLATGKFNMVTVVLKEDIRRYSSRYYLKMIMEISRLLCRHNLNMRVSDYEDAMEKKTDCDAYITIALDNKDFRAFSDTKYVPVIAVDTVIDDFLFYNIYDDFKQIHDSAVNELGCNKIALLTADLPDSALLRAQQAFDDIVVVRNDNDIKNADKSICYATVYNYLASVVAPAKVWLASGSCALKASAAVEYVIHAINRVEGLSHDIRV